jgi:hypothetical protein
MGKVATCVCCANRQYSQRAAARLPHAS